MHFSEADFKHLQTKMSDKNTWTLLLSKAVNKAIYASQLKERGRQETGFDIFAYLDALFLLSENLHPEDFFFGALNASHLEGVCICHWQTQDPALNTEVQPGILLASSSVAVLNIPMMGEDFKHIKRVLGFHNLSTQQILLADKKINLIIPFEMMVFLDKRALPREDVPASLMFALEPNNSVFEVCITPAPVSGLIINDHIQAMQAYVTHPKILFEELKQVDGWRGDYFSKATDDDIKMAIQWDTQLALKLLKHRYLLDISDDYIQKVGRVDQRIKELHDEHGAVILEL